MSLLTAALDHGRSAVRGETPWPARLAAALIGGVAIIAVAVGAGIVAAPRSSALELADYTAAHTQSFSTGDIAAPTVAARDGYEATPGIESLAASGTNYDFARIVLIQGGWPVTDDSITVITRWMRQENYVDNWWNRNNPLNNGWGAIGGSFLGGNPDLVDAAYDIADAINTNPGYSEIRAGFANGADASTIEAAIWASPWATGHYDNGAHWSYAPVDEITAPASAWGR